MNRANPDGDNSWEKREALYDISMSIISSVPTRNTGVAVSPERMLGRKEVQRLLDGADLKVRC